MALTWSGRRQVLYASVVAVVALFLVWGLWQALFAAAPTCFDGKQNGDELGVDCGGSCTLLCQSQTRAPVVLWARAFEVAPGTYNAVAYIENKNVGAGARTVAYSFRLKDSRNVLVVERDGMVNLPPVPLVPIIETGINVGDRTVSSAEFAFDGSRPIQWVKNTQSLQVPRVVQQANASDYSRLSAQLLNDSVDDLYGATAVAVLFDAQGNALAASKSTVPFIPRRSSQQVTFTWPQGVAGVARYEITVLPSF